MFVRHEQQQYHNLMVSFFVCQTRMTTISQLDWLLSLFIRQVHFLAPSLALALVEADAAVGGVAVVVAVDGDDAVYREASG